jgi:transcriptional regulator with XRE-family HTH domain
MGGSEMTQPDPQAEIRANFRARRRRLGLRLEDMADLLGVHRLAYYRYEHHSRLTPEIRAGIDHVLTELEADLAEQGKAL